VYGSSDIVVTDELCHWTGARDDIQGSWFKGGTLGAAAEKCLASEGESTMETRHCPESSDGRLKNTYQRCLYMGKHIYDGINLIHPLS